MATTSRDEMRLSANFPCPVCGQKFHQFVDEMTPGAERGCPHCDATIKFSGDDGRRAQEALDGLVKRLRSWKTKDVKIKI